MKLITYSKWLLITITICLLQAIYNIKSYKISDKSLRRTNLKKLKNNKAKKTFTKKTKLIKKSISSLSAEEEYQKAIGIKNYFKLLNKTNSNTENLELSKPFTSILEKAASRFPKEKTKAIAELEIEKLRKLSTAQAADYFVNLKINNPQDYWYYYYLLSKVALKGRANETHKLTGNWELPDPSEEPDSDFTNDDFHQKLKAKDSFFAEKLNLCKKETLADIKKALFKLRNTSSFIKNHENETELEIFAMDFAYAQNVSELAFSDFQYSDSLIMKVFIELPSYLKKTILFGMPKGIIHHIHLSAAFNDFTKSLKSFLDERKKALNLNNLNIEFVLAYVNEEDKIKKGQFFNVPYPKLFFVEDAIEVISKNYTAENKKVFKENFILEDGRCVATPTKDKSLKFEANLKAVFYWKYCSMSWIFTDRYMPLYSLVNKNKEKYNFPFNKLMAIKPFPVLFTVYLKRIGNIITQVNEKDIISHANIENNVQKYELPKSFLDLTFSKEDLFSNSIWYKFESIFGLYENLFDNPLISKELVKNLAEDLSSQKVYGVEFRQKYDVEKKENSKVSALREALNSKKILSAFILPGRKTVNKNNLEASVKEINKNKDEDVSGIDFVGFEDDPFTGARNFFSANVLEKKVVDANKNKISEFDLLFNALKNGKRFYPHAGETLFIPDYAIEETFMDKYYINDNLIHSALLPNVERLGHGFAVINNGLLATIFKKKKISLEICPISNQLLNYHKVYENPGLKLLRHGLKVAISPDDPGFFGYMGVGMDWFYLIMQTDIKASEIYMMLKNSILKASPNIKNQKDNLVKRLKRDFNSFMNQISNGCDMKQDTLESIVISDKVKELRERNNVYQKRKMDDLAREKLNVSNLNEKLLLNIYSIKDIIEKSSDK